jgi:insulysin
MNRLRYWSIGWLVILLSTCTGLRPELDPSMTIIQSPDDNRVYQSLVLENQLEVLLISDPTADQAAAAMSVRVGQFDDPPDRQGLAHFLEHMLFLGNEKYPEPDEFGQYLAAHGGRMNAFTALEETNYFFSVQPDHLDGALDRFAQFFIAPRFDARFVEREVNAVHSEHQKNLTSDERRIYQVVRSTSNPSHPFQRFGTGNLATLKAEGDDDALRQSLIDFYQRHYSAAAMKLVILGKEPIEELTRMAETGFTAIPNRGQRMPDLSDIPVVETPLKRTLHVRPLQSIRQLRLMFPISVGEKLDPDKSVQVIAHLLGDEGPGSILSALKQQHLATALSAGSGQESSGFAFLNIHVTLTPKGLQQFDRVMAVIFGYIRLLQAEPDLSRYFDELRRIAEADFRFREEEPSTAYAAHLASAMHEVPVTHVLVFPWFYEAYSHNAVKELLNRLSPDNLQVILVAPELAVDQQETWYGTEYSVYRRTGEIEDRWNRVPDGISLSLPPPNPFIADRLVWRQRSSVEPYPVLLQDQPRLRLWFKPDNHFRVPKGVVRVRLSSLLAYDTVENAAMARLFSSLLEERLSEYAYPARVAGMRYSVSNTVQGIELTISGYADNIDRLLQTIFDEIMRFEVDTPVFFVLRDQLREERENQKLSPAYRRAGYEMFHLMTQPLWHTDAYLAVIDDLEPEALTGFVSAFRSCLHIELLAVGDFTADEIHQWGDRLKGFVCDCSDGSASVLTERTIALSAGASPVLQLPVADVNSAVQIHYQVGPTHFEQSVALDLLAQFIEKPAFHQLRTLEQLGYLVWSGYQKVNNVDGFIFLVQSADRDPVFLQSRIEAFLQGFQAELANVTSDSFEQSIATLIAKREEKPRTLQEEALRYWGEITAGRYAFDHRSQEIEVLRQLTWSTVLQLYEKTFVRPETSRRLIVQAVGKAHKAEKPTGLPITDPFQFKTQMPFFDNPERVIESRPLSR